MVESSSGERAMVICRCGDRNESGFNLNPEKERKGDMVLASDKVFIVHSVLSRIYCRVSIWCTFVLAVSHLS